MRPAGSCWPGFARSPKREEQSSRPVDEDLLGGFGGEGFVGSFDEFAALEDGAGADECDQVGCVHRASAVLGSLQELEGHGQAGGPRSRPAGELAAVAHGGEGRLDRVGRAQVDPVLGREVVERQ